MNLKNFEKSIIEDFLMYNNNIVEKTIKTFLFITNKLKIQNKNLISKLNWFENKNYEWAAININNTNLLIRKYKTHFTIYMYTNELYIFDFFVNKNKLNNKENDELLENPTKYIDIYINNLINTINNKKSFLLTNRLETLIPEYINIKIAILGKSIYSIDLLIFALEELSSIELQLFSEIEMYEIIKNLKKGDIINKQEIDEIYTELTDNYYYNIGIKFKNSNDIKDVYYLTKYHYDELVGKNIK